MNQPVNLDWVKMYPYQGSKIFVQQVGPISFQFLIVYRNNLYNHYFQITEKTSLKHAERGGAIFLVCNAAEGLVDTLKKKHSLWYNLFAKHWTPDLGQPAVERIQSIHTEYANSTDRTNSKSMVSESSSGDQPLHPETSDSGEGESGQLS